MISDDEDISNIYPNHYLKMDYVEKKTPDGFETFFIQNNKYEGVYKKYDFDGPIAFINYANGNKHGDSIFFQNEKIIKKEVYNNNELVETFKYEYDGYWKSKVQIVDNKRNGVYLEWFQDILIKKGFYKNDMKNGNFYQYYSNGCLKSKNQYQDDKKNGISLLWLPNPENNKKPGPISYLYHYVNDKKNGKFIEYMYPKVGDPNFTDHPGHIKKGYYINDSREGLFLTLNWNKIIIEKIFYSKNLKNGEFKKYDTNGDLYEKGFYKNGKREGCWIVYYPNLYASQQGKQPKSYEEGLISSVSSEIESEKNLQKRLVYYYENDMKCGKFTKFFPHGGIFSRGYFINDKIEGKVSFFFLHPDKNIPPKVHITRFYKDSKRNGLEYIYNQKQELVEKNYYKNHLQHGLNVQIPNNIYSIYHYGTKCLMQKPEIDICSICYEKTQYQSKCNHFICRQCFENLNNLSCPICRRVLDYNEL